MFAKEVELYLWNPRSSNTRGCSGDRYRDNLINTRINTRVSNGMTEYFTVYTGINRHIGYNRYTNIDTSIPFSCFF